MAIGVADREQPIADRIFGQTIAVVIALALLVLDHGALLIQFVLADRAEQMPHPVAFEEQRHIERAAGHGFNIVGPVIPGRAIGRSGPGGLQRNVEIGDVFGSAEHQVFKQMGKAGAALGLVLRSDPVVGGDPHDRRLAIGVNQHGQAIGQCEFFIGNVDRLDQIAERRGLRWQRLRHRAGAGRSGGQIGRGRGRTGRQGKGDQRG